MTVFRWIIGVLSALVMAGGVLSFITFIITGADEWLGLARRFRHWIYVALLFWFNTEIWGRVILTLVRWK